MVTFFSLLLPNLFLCRLVFRRCCVVSPHLLLYLSLVNCIDEATQLIKRKSYIIAYD